jgi:hypothetical protein
MLKSWKLILTWIQEINNSNNNYKISNSKRMLQIWGIIKLILNYREQTQS